LANPPETKNRTSLEPMIWSCLIYIFSLALVFYYFPKEQAYIEDVISQGGAIPEYSVLPILAYFFGVVIIFGAVLFFIPVSRLKFVLKIMFGFFYIWGVFIVLALILPWRLATPLAAGIAGAMGVLWFFFPLVWLQNLLLMVTLVSVGAVFGALVSPWTVVYVLLAISVYDIVAVRFGYMMWMAKKLSETDTLPAFILPKKAADWKMNLRGASVQKLFKDESAERDFSLLGGGDLGFPLAFVVAVFFEKGFNGALVVAGATLAGLIFAYALQIFVLKGKPLPAIPPISFLAIIGFLIVNYLL
jgi:presenilin-like A22 family membrane protease